MPIQDANPTPSKPRVLLIGWDGADWIVLNQLMDAGRMPHLLRFVEPGVIGNNSLTHALPNADVVDVSGDRHCR